MHKHLYHTGTTAKVAINLEGRMSVQQVGIGTAASACIGPLIPVRTYVREQFSVDVIGVLGIVQTGIEVDTPTGTPPRRAVAPNLQRLVSCLMQILYAVHAVGKTMTGINTEEVTLMTVIRVFVVPVVEPFLEIALLTYLIWLQTRERLVYLSHEILIGSQLAGSIAGIGQAFTNHREVGRAAIESASMITLWCHIVVLGRCAGAGE